MTGGSSEGFALQLPPGTSSGEIFSTQLDRGFLVVKAEGELESLQDVRLLYE